MLVFQVKILGFQGQNWSKLWFSRSKFWFLCQICQSFSFYVKFCPNFGFSRSKFRCLMSKFWFIKVKIGQKFGLSRSKLVKILVFQVKTLGVGQICQNFGFLRSKFQCFMSKFWFFKVQICQSLVFHVQILIKILGFKVHSHNFGFFYAKMWVFLVLIIKFVS